jgi:hypothetical protein
VASRPRRHQLEQDGNLVLCEEVEVCKLPMQFITDVVILPYKLKLSKMPVASTVSLLGGGDFTYNVIKYIQNSLSFFACKHMPTCLLYKTFIKHSLKLVYFPMVTRKN